MPGMRQRRKGDMMANAIDAGGERAAVSTEHREGVLLITLDRPEARNAVNAAMAEGVAAAIDELETNDAIRVGIIAGAGGTFCSGMDLKAYLRGESPVAGGRGFGGIVERPPSKPLIAAVEGYALAGGMEIALSCDLIVAARTASFGLPEVKRGLIAAAGGLMRLPRRIPHAIAMELALTGAMLPAEKAHGLGLINHVCDGSTLDAALELARAIAANGPLAVQASKQIVDQARLWPDEDMWRRQRAISDPVFASEDAREGPLAFAEKRMPRWTGR